MEKNDAMTNYMTVSEYARYVGISTQAVYKQLKTNKLKSVMVGNSKFIDVTGMNVTRDKEVDNEIDNQNEADDNQGWQETTKVGNQHEGGFAQSEREFYEVFGDIPLPGEKTGEDSSQDATIKALEKTIDVLTAQVDMLNNQLQVKDEQIRQLSQQLDRVHNLMDQEQKLHITTLNRFELLEKKTSENESENANQSQRKPFSFFRRKSD